MQVVWDQNNWQHLKVSGNDRLRFLNGMVSGNVKDLLEGQWMRTLMLSHKARILAIFEMSAFAEHIIISCEPSLRDKTFETLDKHIVMDDVEIDPIDLEMHTVWNSAAEVWTAAPVFAAAPSPSPASEIECRRIEAGLPRYGVDVDESNFPFESPLVRLINYKKGCFTGQEPVSRVQARGGGGSKQLLGLRAEGDPLPVGATVSTSERPAGGEVRSAVISEEFGSIALAYVHKSAWQPGTEVKVGERVATVSQLPFASS